MEYLTCDITDPNVTMDNESVRVSEYIYEDKFNDLTVDNTLLNIECSNNSLTSDRISINVLD